MYFDVFIFSSLFALCSSSCGTCKNSKTNESSCCTDYYDYFGSCLPCMGSYGPNCSSICPNGYFGHGCRHKCSCASTQWCDAVIGCSSKINEPLKNYVHMEYVYNALSRVYGINSCFNSQSKKLECCKGFANIKGICEGKENIKNENAIIFFIFY
nr:multiple epidermal growth factor-like domains protein 6 [Crassostrea gigas]